MLPRKQTGIDRSDETLRAVAFQIGTLVAIERNRRRLTQAALGKKVGLEAVAISRIENGDPLSAVDDAKVDALFKTLGLSVSWHNYSDVIHPTLSYGDAAWFPWEGATCRDTVHTSSI